MLYSIDVYHNTLRIEEIGAIFCWILHFFNIYRDKY